MLKLSLLSLLDRKGSVMLSYGNDSQHFRSSGVEHIRHQTKENFSSTVSGVDLIVGARTGSLNLLYILF